MRVVSKNRRPRKCLAFLVSLSQPNGVPSKAERFPLEGCQILRDSQRTKPILRNDPTKVLQAPYIELSRRHVSHQGTYLEESLPKRLSQVVYMMCCSGECILKPIIGQNDKTKYAHEGTLGHHFAKFDWVCVWWRLQLSTLAWEIKWACVKNGGVA